MGFSFIIWQIWKVLPPTVEIRMWKRLYTEYQASVDYQKTHTVIKEIMDKNVQKLNNEKKIKRQKTKLDPRYLEK